MNIGLKYICTLFSGKGWLDNLHFWFGFSLVSTKMGVENKTGTTRVTARFLLMSGVALVFFGLAAGYAMHDLFNPGSATSKINTLPKGSVTGLEAATGNYSKTHLVQKRPSAGLKQITTRKTQLPDRALAGLQKSAPDQDALLEAIDTERTLNLSLDIGSSDEDPDFAASEQDLVSELLAKHEFEYHRQQQLMAETEAWLSPPTPELDEDSLEDEHLLENLPAVTQLEEEDLLWADQQLGDNNSEQGDTSFTDGDTAIHEN